MENTETFSFVVPASIRSFGDDNWQETEAAYIEAWKSALSLLSERQVSREGAVYLVCIDWLPLLRRHERHYSAMEYLYRGGAKDIARRVTRARFPRRPTRIRVTAQTNAKEAKHSFRVAQSVIHDVFLIMNIAAPGCCNFYRAKLIGEKAASEISLSSGEFELCILPARQPRPTVKFVPVSKVVAWYDAVRATVAQVPSSPTERTLFALLHLAKDDGDVLAVIWFFYGLESLLQTKVGENFSSIIRRLALLLGLPNAEVVTLKKQLRVLYDMRSAIVHGGFETMHPMKDEGLDKRVNVVFGRLLSAIEYSQVLLVASIQRMVVENWPQLKFDEIIVVEK